MAATSGREPLLTGQGHQTTPASAVNSGSSGREQKEHLFNEVECKISAFAILSPNHAQQKQYGLAFPWCFFSAPLHSS